jgi:choline dehydrogenase-like flavoprotein
VGAAKRLWDAYSQRRRPEAPVRDALRVVGAPGALAAEVRARRRGTGSPPDRHTRLGLRVQTEQSPIGESAVTLGGTRDRYGSRLPRVHWTVGEAEQRTCRAVAEAARAAFEGAGLGRVVLEPWLDDLDAVRRRAEDFYHHAGTTRMAASASDGVVDVHGAVHGTTGLHVAGASVFPTSGYANPTLTIVALALRLGHHLTC